MDKIKDQHARLAWARETAGYESAAAAATSMSIKIPTYSSHENGWRGFGLHAAKRYARKFNVNLEWLLTGDGIARPNNTDLTASVNSSSSSVPQDGGGKREETMPRNQIIKLFDRLPPQRQLELVLQLLKEVEEMEETDRPTRQRA